MMGFSMATAMDPQSGVSMPIISQFLSLMSLIIPMFIILPSTSAHICKHLSSGKLGIFLTFMYDNFFTGFM